MGLRGRLGFLIPLCLVFLAATEILFAQVNMTMHRNDLQRTGANLNETILNTSNVNQNNFGKLWTYSVGGQVYAQPLYVSAVDIPGKGTRNVLYVADMHNDVYAFDADQPSLASTPYWQVSYGNSVPLADANIGPGLNYTDIRIEIGIMSTPVIDLSTNTIYFVTKTKVASVFADSLHALDIRTGQPKFGGSQLIAATVPGTGEGGRAINFVSNKQNNRSAMMLSNGIVYVSYGSYGDATPTHGWIIGYDASNINQQKIAYSTTPNSRLGSIWMAGEGPSVDSFGNIYIVTGNGHYLAGDLGETMLKLTPDPVHGTLIQADYFTPYNKDSLDLFDTDLGSSGMLLIPNSHLLVNGGKEGVIYLVDEDNMGQFNSGTNPSADHVVQRFQAVTNELFMTGAYWGDSIANPNTGLLYVWSPSDVLKAYRFNGQTQQFNTTAFATSSNSYNPQFIPMASLSANGHNAGSGIVWVNFPNAYASEQTVSGTLLAFNASTLSELWNSNQVPDRDSLGSYAKFVTPTVTNGKVYMATFSGIISVYGLLSALPVVFMDFNAKREQRAVRLHWSTASEQDNDRFDVMHSSDGRHFRTIGSIKGHGNSAVQRDYYYVDSHAENGINYYRLNQVDVDGKSNYSRTIYIKMDLKNNINVQIFPNPAHDRVTIRCDGLRTGDIVSVEMYTSGGFLVHKQSAKINEELEIQIPRSKLMYTGVYYIRITLPSGEMSEERLVWGS